MPLEKRVFDLLLLIISAPLVIVLTIAIAMLCWAFQGRPIFFLQARAGENTQEFLLWKFRTMAIDYKDCGVTGGDKTGRVTPLGRVLRRCHLDELPQLWNILKGEMSFVGPRPPLPTYVAAQPNLYRVVLLARPGLTGLATCVFSSAEVKLLATAKTASETETLYQQVCVPRKARLDLVYLRRWSLWLDLRILVWTFTGRRRLAARAGLVLPATKAAPDG